MRKALVCLSFSTYLLTAVLVRAAAPAKPASGRKPVAVNLLKTRGISPDLATLLTDVLRSELMATNAFQVMNREDMGTVMNEVKLAAMGACSGRNCLVDTGKALGVAKMVGGSMGKLGKKYIFTLKLVDLNTTKNEIQFTETYEGPEEGLDKVMKNLALRLAGKRKPPAPASLLAKYPPEGMVLVPADAKIISADGKVMILASEKDSQGKAVKTGAAIPQGAVLATSDKSKARVQLANGSILDLKPQTKIAFNTLESAKTEDVSWSRVKVVTGGLLARVKKLTSRKSGFEIQSGEAVCGVRGTIVGAGADGDFQTYTGDVVVEENGESNEVASGFEYDDGDVNLIEDQDQGSWGDLTNQGVNPGEGQEGGQGSGQGAAPAGGTENVTPPPAENSTTDSAAAPAVEEGTDNPPADELLTVGDDVQTDVGGEVLDQFETITHGTVNINVEVVEMSSGG